MLLASPKVPERRPSGAAPQFSDAEVRERVEAYRGTIDVPVTAGRAKALEGLIAAAPDRAAKLVGPMARDEREATVVRVTAMDGVAELLPSRAMTELKPVMQSARSAGLRGAAADALSRRKDGCAAVRAQAGREKGDEREAFHRALSRCGE